MGKKRIAVAVAVMALSLGATLPAQADPVIGGSIEVSTLGDTLHPGCSGLCEAFFDADCPEDRVDADGVTTSIVDVSELGGETLDFTWDSAGNHLYDELHPTTGTLTPRGRAFFYIVDSCVQPQWFTFALLADPDRRSMEWTIPEGSTWVIVQVAETDRKVTWQADLTA